MYITYLLGELFALIQFLFNVQLPSFFNSISLFQNWWG